MLSGSAAVVTRVSRILGRVRVPGDKSISHRYAMLAAIADGTSHLDGYSPGADCAATLSCLEAFGVPIARRAASAGLAIEVQGLGLRGLRAPGHPLDAVNSGTSMRLLSGLAAAHPFRTVIGGDESLSRRPMRRVIEPLTKMGATIAAVDGRPPLTIDGADLQPITHAPSVPSAQVKSAVLLAGLHARGRTEVVEPSATRDHTERALAAFGVRVDRAGLSVSLEGGQRLRAADLVIPGDISSAVFWLVLAAGRPGSTLESTVSVSTRRGAPCSTCSASAGAEIETDDRGRHWTLSRASHWERFALRGSAPRPFQVEPDDGAGRSSTRSRRSRRSPR